MAAVALGTFTWATGRLDIHGVGYAGVFAVNLVGSATIFIPLPGIAVLCGGSAEEAGLNPVLLGAAGGAGSAVGEITSYLADYGGGTLVQRSKHYARLRQWVERHGAIPLLLMAALPLPLGPVHTNRRKCGMVCAWNLPKRSTNASLPSCPSSGATYASRIAKS